MSKGIIVVDRWLVTGRDGRRGRRALLPEAKRCPPEARFLGRAYVDGKYVNHACPSAEQAEKWAEGVKSGTSYVPRLSKATVTEIGAAYIDALRNRPGGRATPTYVAQVQRCIDGLLSAGADHMDNPAFADRVRNWLVHLKVKKAYGKIIAPSSDSYRRTMLVLTRALVRFAINRNLLDRDPTRVIKLARPMITRRRVFTVEELRAMVSDQARWMDHGKREEFLAAVRTHGSQAAAAKALDVPLTTLHCRIAAEPRPDPWWRYAVVTAYTGLRSSEAVAMRWHWLDIERGILKVPADSPGNRYRKERRCRLQPEFLDLLRGPFKDGASPSLPVIGPVAEIAVDEQARCQGFRDYLKRCGIELKGRNSHCVRHSVCSLMTALNASHFLVMEAVGHSSVAVTKGYSDGARDYLEDVRDWPRCSDWPEFWLRRIPDAKAQTAESTVR